MPCHKHVAAHPLRPTPPLGSTPLVPVIRLPGYQHLSADQVGGFRSQIAQPVIQTPALALIPQLTADQFLEVLRHTLAQAASPRTFWLGALVAHYDATQSSPHWRFSDDESTQLTGAITTLRQLPRDVSDLGDQVATVFSAMDFNAEIIPRVFAEVRMAMAQEQAFSTNLSGTDDRTVSAIIGFEWDLERGVPVLKDTEQRLSTAELETHIGVLEQAFGPVEKALDTLMDFQRVTATKPIRTDLSGAVTEAKQVLGTALSLSEYDAIRKLLVGLDGASDLEALNQLTEQITPFSTPQLARLESWITTLPDAKQFAGLALMLHARGIDDKTRARLVAQLDTLAKNDAVVDGLSRLCARDMDVEGVLPVETAVFLGRLHHLMSHYIRARVEGRLAANRDDALAATRDLLHRLTSAVDTSLEKRILALTLASIIPPPKQVSSDNIETFSQDLTLKRPFLAGFEGFLTLEEYRALIQKFEQHKHPHAERVDRLTRVSSALLLSSATPLARNTSQVSLGTRSNGSRSGTDSPPVSAGLSPSLQGYQDRLSAVVGRTQSVVTQVSQFLGALGLTASSLSMQMKEWTQHLAKQPDIRSATFPDWLAQFKNNHDALSALLNAPVETLGINGEWRARFGQRVAARHEEAKRHLAEPHLYLPESLAQLRSLVKKLGELQEALPTINPKTTLLDLMCNWDEPLQAPIPEPTHELSVFYALHPDQLISYEQLSQYCHAFRDVCSIAGVNTQQVTIHYIRTLVAAIRSGRPSQYVLKECATEIAKALITLPNHNDILAVVAGRDISTASVSNVRPALYALQQRLARVSTVETLPADLPTLLQSALDEQARTQDKWSQLLAWLDTLAPPPAHPAAASR